jgi:carbon monoxide dehydrogenase subunit G
MTVAIDAEVRIARPVGEVYAALVDVERWPAWLIATGIVKVERLDEGPLRAGSRLRVAQSLAGRAATLDGVVTVLAPDAAFGVQGRDRDGIEIRIDAVVAPDDLAADGPATRLRWSAAIKLPFRYRLFESMVTPQARKAASLDLEALRQRLETGAA